MDPKVEIGEFVATRRARITPGQAGLPDCGENVLCHRRGVTRPRHLVVGVLELVFGALVLGGDPGLRVFVHMAAAGTPCAAALTPLVSWAAIQDQAHQSP